MKSQLVTGQQLVDGRFLLILFEAGEGLKTREKSHLVLRIFFWIS